MSVTDHFRAALGAVFLGQVKAGADFALYKRIRCDGISGSGNGAEAD